MRRGRCGGRWASGRDGGPPTPANIEHGVGVRAGLKGVGAEAEMGVWVPRLKWAFGCLLAVGVGAEA